MTMQAQLLMTAECRSSIRRCLDELRFLHTRITLGLAQSECETYRGESCTFMVDDRRVEVAIDSLLDVLEPIDVVDEPEIDDSVKCCPDCERPNQFGEVCQSCQRDRDDY